MDVNIYKVFASLFCLRLNQWVFMTVSGILEQHLILGQQDEPKALPWKTTSPAALVLSAFGARLKNGDNEALRNWKDDLELSVVRDGNDLCLRLELRSEGSFPSTFITDYVPLNLTDSLWQPDT